jgi:hypothetical protein
MEQKLIVAQLLKKFPAPYKTRKFITVFTRALYWSLHLQAVESGSQSPNLSLRSI